MAIYDVPINELIVKTAEALKKVESINPPEWAAFVKTGAFKERPPTNSDWWFFRSASLLRKIVILGPIGVSKLRTKFGGRKRSKVSAESFYLGSGNIIRKILQQLEKAGLAEKASKGVHKGRSATKKGTAFLESIASEMLKEKGITMPAKPKGELKPDVLKKAKKLRAPRKKKAKEEKPAEEKKEMPAEKPVEPKPAGTETKAAEAQ